MKNKRLSSIFFNILCNGIYSIQTQMKVFRFDNGCEYVNNTLDCFFCDQGITHQTKTPFTLQQNGVSEWKDRHIMMVVRSLMLDKFVLDHFLVLQLWLMCI